MGALRIMNNEAEKNYFWINLNGHSMYPTLLDQDEILIKSIKISELQLGDIVLFIDKDSRELTLHRLIGFPLITKGDFSHFLETNTEDLFLGKAVSCKRGLQMIGLTNNKWLLIFSKLRLKNRVLRYTGLIGLHLISMFSQFYNAKTKLDHNKRPQKDDLSSHA